MLNKISFFLLISLGLPLCAETHMLQNSFWSTSFDDVNHLELKSVDANFVKDCRDFTDYVFDQKHNLQVQRPEEFDDARTLPIQGQMRDTYLAVFKVQEMKRSSGKASEEGPYSARPVVSLQLSGLQNAQVASDGDLVAVSLHLGLLASTVQIIKREDQVLLQINGRDLACDLLQNKIKLNAQVQYAVSPNAEEMLRLNKFYTRVETITASVLSQTEDPVVRASLMGYRYGQLYNRQKNSNEEMRQNLELLKQSLFLEDSFELNSIWKSLGGRYFVVYPKIQFSDFIGIPLKVVL
jgi:hypothetical protein